MINAEERFAAAGYDYAALFERTLGDSELINELLGLFLSDESFGKMCGFMAKGETENAFKAAHSLKGSCGMLGLNGLFDKMVIITDELRHGNLEGAENILPQTSAEYEKALSLIKELIC